MWKGGVIFLLFFKKKKPPLGSAATYNICVGRIFSPVSVSNHMLAKLLSDLFKQKYHLSQSLRSGYWRFSRLWWLASAGSQRLSSCSSWRLRMKWWTNCCDQLFPGFKTHLRPSHAIAGTSTTWIYTEMEAEISVPSEASYWWTKTDPQYTAFCLNSWN